MWQQRLYFKPSLPHLQFIYITTDIPP